MLSENDVLMTDEEMIGLARELSLHNSIFYTIWSVSRIYFTDVVDTACICFDKEHHVIGIYLNRAFWNSLPDAGQKFVIMHECLHMFFDHGRRFDSAYSNTANNVAQDIVINETITVSMGIDRYVIPNWENYCFIDTCFKDFPVGSIKANQTFSYYLEKLSSLKTIANFETVDDHDMNSLPDDVLSDVLDQFKANASESDIDEIMEVFEKIETDEKKEGKGKNNSNGAGISSDPIVTFIYEVKRDRIKRQKKTWMKLVKKMTPSKELITYEKEEGWRERKRQHSILDSNLMIIGESEREIVTKLKYDVFVYIDISGSCANLVKPFYDLLYTFPEENFNITTFTFNTSVKEFEWKKKRPVSNGGTCFKCINYSVEQRTLEKGKHPDVVFVFTDGDGTAYQPTKPEKWVWVLSKDNKRYIHKNSKTFQMNDFK